jgi:hypothetical protein
MPAGGDVTADGGAPDGTDDGDGAPHATIAGARMAIRQILPSCSFFGA